VESEKVSGGESGRSAPTHRHTFSPAEESNHHTLVKICGITNLEDALIAAEAGADMLGFIFYPPSARYVSPESVRQIVQSLKYQVQSRMEMKPDLKLETLDLKPSFVGVFVNSPAAEIRDIMDFCGLDLAQLHGDESPEMVAGFHGRAFKAISPSSLPEAENISSRVIRHAPCVLLDAFHPTERGGTGLTADWKLAARLAAQYPVLLAGGLTPENVADAIRTVRPFGVDVSSGVEASKGKKDPAKVRAFIAQVRK